jgi:hypothetical protein
VPARAARFGLYDGVMIVVRDRVVVRNCVRGLLVPVDRRTVVMVRMIVADVLVDVGKRCHRGREDQSLGEHAGGEATHLGSLLRPCVSNWKRRHEPL